ncbi:hypothetical protein LY78DRAFT_401325 [Colletotrichum sublineola]|nr:hypothetical protein LY78DRAFT_401325 [Colletotrichum sublineola]
MKPSWPVVAKVPTLSRFFASWLKGSLIPQLLPLLWSARTFLAGSLLGLTNTSTITERGLSFSWSIQNLVIRRTRTQILS